MVIRAFKPALAVVLATSLAGMMSVSSAGPLNRQFRLAKFYAAHGGKRLPGKVLSRVVEELGLTEEQRSDVQDVLDAYGPRLEALRETMTATGFRLMNLAPEDRDYDRAVDALSRSSGQQVASMLTTLSHIRRDFHGVLTPEQRVLAAEMKAEVFQNLTELLEILEETS